MKPKMTDWFPPHIKPCRKGVFEILMNDGVILLSKWNGSYWGVVHPNSEWASFTKVKSIQQSKMWRGFTEKQE